MSKTIDILEGQTGKIKYKPTFRGEPALKKVTVDNNSTVLNNLIIPGERTPLPDEVHGELDFTAKGKGSGDLDIVFVYDNKVGGAEGKDISTQKVGINITPAQMSFKSSGPYQIKQADDALYHINMVMKNGDQSVPATHPALENASADKFEIVSSTADTVTVKMLPTAINKDPNVWNTNFALSLKMYSSTISHPFGVHWKPTLTITSTVAEVAMGSKGAIPFKALNSKGDDITTTLTNIACTDEYFKFDATGAWEIIKDVTEDTTRTLHFTFTYRQGAFDWDMSAEVTIKIMARPKSISAAITSPKTASSLTRGTVQFTLKYDNGEPVTDATYISSTNDSPRTSFSSFGGSLTKVDGPKGIYSTPFTTGYEAGWSSSTFKINTKYGEYTVRVLNMQTYDEPLSISSDYTSLSYNEKNAKFSISATQQRSIGGTPVNVTGTLRVSFVRGATIASGPTGSGPWTLGLNGDGERGAVDMNLSVGNLIGTLRLYKA